MLDRWIDDQDDEVRLGIYIDCENNYVTEHIHSVMSNLPEGVTSVAKAYGDWSNPRLSNCTEQLHHYGISVETVVGASSKASISDMYLIKDATRDMYQGKYDHLVLITADSDFHPLALEARSVGLDVTVIGLAVSRHLAAAASHAVVLNGVRQEDLDGYCNTLVSTMLAEGTLTKIRNIHHKVLLAGIVDAHLKLNTPLGEWLNAKDVGLELMRLFPKIYCVSKYRTMWDIVKELPHLISQRDSPDTREYQLTLLPAAIGAEKVDNAGNAEVNKEPSQSPAKQECERAEDKNRLYRVSAAPNQTNKLPTGKPSKAAEEHASSSPTRLNTTGSQWVRQELMRAGISFIYVKHHFGGYAKARVITAVVAAMGRLGGYRQWHSEKDLEKKAADLLSGFSVAYFSNSMRQLHELIRHLDDLFETRGDFNSGFEHRLKSQFRYRLSLEESLTLGASKTDKIGTDEDWLVGFSVEAGLCPKALTKQYGMVEVRRIAACLSTFERALREEKQTKGSVQKNVPLDRMSVKFGLLSRRDDFVNEMSSPEALGAFLGRYTHLFIVNERNGQQIVELVRPVPELISIAHQLPKRLNFN